MIYIDPPYNTGNDFIYPDNYSVGCSFFVAPQSASRPLSALCEIGGGDQAALIAGDGTRHS